nr:hypothetical protein [Streptomyces sp. N35]
MTRHLAHECQAHPDPYDCPDALAGFSAKFAEYGLIIHDGSRASSTIAYCPWCGARLPASQRDRWFDELERAGIDPWRDKVPPEFEDGRWMQGVSGDGWRRCGRLAVEWERLPSRPTSA